MYTAHILNTHHKHALGGIIAEMYTAHILNTHHKHALGGIIAEMKMLKPNYSIPGNE